MQNANVFIVDDDEDILEGVRLELKKAGHHVPLGARDLGEALAIINNGQLIREGINLAVIDGSFPRTYGDLNNIFGGPIIAKVIRDEGFPIKIVAYSSYSADKANYGDVYADKLEGLKSLIQAVASL